MISSTVLLHTVGLYLHIWVYNSVVCVLFALVPVFEGWLLNLLETHSLVSSVGMSDCHEQYHCEETFGVAADPYTGFNPTVEMSFSKKGVPVCHRHCTLTVHTTPALFLLLTALENLSWGLLIGLSIHY